MAASPARRPAAQQARGFSLGDLGQYSSGGIVPEGDYALEFQTRMYQGTKKDGSAAGPERLGVMITLYPLGGGEHIEQFYSFGSNAHQSWAPNDSGKGIVAVPGGPGTAPNASTNWAVFLKSLYDSGLPQGVFDDDFSMLDGIHVHMANVPEPTERKSFATKTGEAAVEDKARTIAVVTEIKDDGKPWEGTGGLDVSKPAPATHGRAAAPPKALGKAHAAGVAANRVAMAASAPALAEDGLYDVAANAVTEVLSLTAHANGCKRLQLRTGTFKAVSTATDAATATKVINEYFSNDGILNELLAPLGYKVKGSGPAAEVVAA